MGTGTPTPDNSTDIWRHCPRENYPMQKFPQKISWWTFPAQFRPDIPRKFHPWEIHPWKNAPVWKFPQKNSPNIPSYDSPQLPAKRHSPCAACLRLSSSSQGKYHRKTSGEECLDHIKRYTQFVWLSMSIILIQDSVYAAAYLVTAADLTTSVQTTALLNLLMILTWYQQTPVFVVMSSGTFRRGLLEII